MTTPPPTTPTEGASPGPLVAYLRVSTDTQANDGHGLDDQRQAIEEWTDANNRAIAAWHTDAGEPGANGIATRLALGRAMDDISKGTASGLVVFKLDRLARDVVLQEQLLAELWRRGAEVCSTSPAEAQYLHPDDPMDPSRKLIRVVLGAVSNYERDMVRLRLLLGRNRKRAAGGYAGGRRPYGWRPQNKELVPVEEEQHVLALMRAMHDQGWSLRRIMDELNAAGHTAQAGGRWHFEQVRRALNQNIRSGSSSSS